MHLDRPTVYVTLSQFCETDERPRQVLLDAGLTVKENRTGRRIRREEMLEALQDADAVLAAVEPYDADLLGRLPRLKCISRCGAGADAIDIGVARQRDIAVLVTADEVAEPVAQMTIGMILALARNFPLHQHDVRAGVWKKHVGYLLSEWTIGLVGFGRIGQHVAQYLRPFGSRLLVADPLLNGNDLSSDIGHCPLEALLAQADLVSLHAGRPAAEGPLLGRRELALMKPGSRLVNTARGYLIDEQALLEALQSGQLVAAALDVFDQEPYQGPLATLPNVLCTPHVATLTRASRAAMELRCAQNVVEYFRKGAKL